MGLRLANAAKEVAIATSWTGPDIALVLVVCFLHQVYLFLPISALRSARSMRLAA